MSQLEQDADAAIELSSELLRQAAQKQTPQERRQQAELDRMLSHPEDKATLVEMTDQAFRTHSTARVADQLTHLLDVQGIPRFFSPVEQVLLRGFQSFGEYLPGVAVPLVKDKMRRETANVILPAEPKLLSEHLQNRQQQGVTMNVNLLGEAILGEAEAQRRIQQCNDALRMPNVRYLSVKISTFYSQISSIARRQTILTVAERLESLYRVALQERDEESDLPKFVYLDMEEYRDLYLTADVLRETLSRDGLSQSRAGIALQAYIPDSDLVLRELIEWSRKRVDDGGVPLTIRLVKGANMEMERVDASIHGFPQAPYGSKIDTDANFKRMLSELLIAAGQGAIRVGVASHNLFDVSLAMIWADRLNVVDAVQFEMLEGMANHQRRAISERERTMVLYAPACFQDSFLNAIGYLIRRLDENTGPENFLRHAYRLTPESEDFRLLANGFRQSLSKVQSVFNKPQRVQDRRRPPVQPPAADHWGNYVNEPDTDWSLPHHSDWIEDVLDRWKSQCGSDAHLVPLQIGHHTVHDDDSTFRESTDPSRPGVVTCRFATASLEQVKKAVQTAASAQALWADTSIGYRHRILRETAQRLRERRGDLIGAMVADAGKTVAQADPEVSEAIDFCEFYPLTVAFWGDHPNVGINPRGIVAVITPWNFPLAIPCGGIAASLAAGNVVILKPASDTVLVASYLCQAFWDAGVPRDCLQLIPCLGKVAEAGLVKNPDICTVILTGGTATARRMLAVRPDLNLLAETGGKNATVVTAMADRDLAIKHVLNSAFGHSGQKCSATSLLLLENEVFDDPSFKAALADAAESQQVGSCWDLSTTIGPMIRPPTGDLKRAIGSLEDEESWLLSPRIHNGNPNLYRPGIKWNIAGGGFMHTTELFGPVLGVMRYSRLEEAISIVRSTGYGLTSGIESLDDREIDLWRETIHAGNLYINRETTGAIVLRQPFGGVGLSAYGPGVKAGGPHYVLPLMKIEDLRPTGIRHHRNEMLHSNLDALKELINESALSGSKKQTVFDAIMQQIDAVETEFSIEHDSVRLLGQDNVRRYRPAASMCIRVEGDSLLEAIIAISACLAVKTQLTLSISETTEDLSKQIFEEIGDRFPRWVHPIEESNEQLATRIRQGEVGRLRLLDNSSTVTIDEASAEGFVTVIREPVLRSGRVECLRYLDEQSVSHTYHRYGNLGRRADEKRRVH